jgi:hypothetical protein
MRGWLILLFGLYLDVMDGWIDGREDDYIYIHLIIGDGN